MKKTLLLCLLAWPLQLPAQTAKGGIDGDLLSRLRRQAAPTAGERALRSALFGADINQLATNNYERLGSYFSNEVPSRGITNQKQSGRCWLFTGLNVMRAKMMQRFDLGQVMFSPSYVFFYDQLEKSNLFLQSIIDCASKPMDDRRVEWLLKHPLSDGGTMAGVIDLVDKYGLVPAEVMPETYAANNTGHMSSLLATRLREDALALRDLARGGAKATELMREKERRLSTVYRMLTLFLGEPPQEFEWTETGRDGRPRQTEHFTPQSFYRKYVGEPLGGRFLFVMDDPLRPYHRTYRIDLDRHTYDGHDWTYLNLPMDEIKQLAIRSIKDSTALYFSCDVGKYLNRKTGVLDTAGYDFASFLGTRFGMTKAQRIATFASASTHAMTLVGVDLDDNGRPRKWKIENSWGEDSGLKGHLIATDSWMNEYLFRLCVERRYADEATLRLADQKPTLLPPWDPMFQAEQ